MTSPVSLFAHKLHCRPKLTLWVFRCGRGRKQLLEIQSRGWSLRSDPCQYVSSRCSSFPHLIPLVGPTGTTKAQGSLAEYITLSSDQVAHKPKSVSFDEAAGLSLVARTAIDALIDIAKIRDGQKVFVNGGSSGVGTIGIQIAKAYGCHVTTSCSGKNAGLVKKLGADEVRDPCLVLQVINRVLD